LRFTDYLKKEHGKLRRFCAYILGVVRQMENGQDVSSSFGNIVKIGEIFRDYHKALEDRLLFAYLQDKAEALKGEHGPLAVLREEHLEADKYMRELLDCFHRIQEKGRFEEEQSLSQLVRVYIQLMLAHIGKEEMAVFPIADTVLTLQDEEILQTKAQEELERTNNRLVRLYEDNLEALRSEYNEHSLEQDEVDLLWKLMHDDPGEI